MERSALLRCIPRVDEMLGRQELSSLPLSPSVLRASVREELALLREEILSGAATAIPESKTLCARIAARAQRAELSPLRSVINASGVVLHTNLGRACLSERAAHAAAETARGYASLEYDIEAGRRGSRHTHVEKLLCDLTGAEAAMAVNNNAAAVLLVLSALGRGGEVVVSRGELVEIGGSFRIPEIITQCGCTLREVGTTNKTHLRDYEAAIGGETKALLKVHTSNYRIVGFTESVPRAALASLAHGRGLPFIEDLGSGTLVDLAPFGLQGEPTVQQSVRAGADIVSFSGDKLLGGPQAGLIVGKKEYIERCKSHPLARALRVDKMTLAALRETLCAYLDPARAAQEIPTLRMLTEKKETLHARAVLLREKLISAGIAAELTAVESQAGGGSLPDRTMKSWAVALLPENMRPDEVEKRMRCRARPVIGRIHCGRFLLDVRTLGQEELDEIVAAAKEALA